MVKLSVGKGLQESQDPPPPPLHRDIIIIRLQIAARVRLSQTLPGEKSREHTPTGIRSTTTLLYCTAKLPTTLICFSNINITPKGLGNDHIFLYNNGLQLYNTLENNFIILPKYSHGTHIL